MDDCSVCETRITSYDLRADRDGNPVWVHLVDGHDDHQPEPTRHKRDRKANAA